MSLPKMYKSCIICSEHGKESDPIENEIDDRQRDRSLKFYLEATSAAHHVAYNEGFLPEEKGLAKLSLKLCSCYCDSKKGFMAKLVKNYIEKKGKFFSMDEEKSIREIGLSPRDLKLYGSDDL